MSGVDLREPVARVDRSAPLDGGQKERDDSLIESRRKRVAILLTVALSLMPFMWLSGNGRRDAIQLPPQFGDLNAPPGIPLEMNARVEHWIDAFQTTRRDEFQSLLDRRGEFEGMIRRKLRERGMPEELLYLAMIESGLSTNAVSDVSAVGIWQFMVPTARQFGLRVDDYVDERRDPVRATDAALDYLQWLYDRFGSWYLAAAAYNAGPGRLERILNLHADGRTGDEDIYWEVLGQLPRETRDYVPRLVATTILANEADKQGLDSSSAPAYEYDMVFVPGTTSLASIAKSLNVDVGVLDDLNPHLIRGVTPPNEVYGVRVPRGDASTVMASLAQRPTTGFKTD
jgi:peptidoglycan lytic transglycosylase D